MITTVLQARFSSSRLPGKVLKEILGRPVLALQIERMKRARHMQDLVVATSTQAEDAAIEALCKKLGIVCCRGALDDVLDRFYQAVVATRPDHVIRVTGDCPLIDPAVVDAVVDFHLAGGYDYTSNTLEPRFPDGLDVEVFRFSCLEQAWNEATLTSQREHVTPFLYQNPQRYRLGSFKNATDLSHLRWTVDTQEDFNFIQEVFCRLYAAYPKFKMQDVLDLLENTPELQQLNAMYHRNEGYEKSLREDKEIRHV